MLSIAGHEDHDDYDDHGKVRTKKKITVLFGNFSQVADPPLPHPPFWETLIRKKNYRLFCILGP